jgi:hypothetical protein
LENRFQQTHLPDAGREKERGESRFFYFIKIMGWEAPLLPNKKMQIASQSKNANLGYLLEVSFWYFL